MLGVGGFLGVLGAIATYVGIVTQALPHAWQPYAILITMAGFATALWATGTSDATVDGVLYRENIKLRNKVDEQKVQVADLARVVKDQNVEITALKYRRRLTPQQKDVIKRIATAKLQEHAKSWVDAGHGEEFGSLCIAVAAVGSETETKDLRNDIMEAFQPTFLVRAEVWPAHSSDLEQFRNSITVLQPDNPKNVIRPMVMAALEDAGIDAKDGPLDYFGPVERFYRPVRVPGSFPAIEPCVNIVVGQR